jgi:hypothetical protein
MKGIPLNLNLVLNVKGNLNIKIKKLILLLTTLKNITPTLLVTLLKFISL